MLCNKYEDFRACLSVRDFHKFTQFTPLLLAQVAVVVTKNGWRWYEEEEEEGDYLKIVWISYPFRFDAQ